MMGAMCLLKVTAGVLAAFSGAMARAKGTRAARICLVKKTPMLLLYANRTKELREEKRCVCVINRLLASGGALWQICASNGLNSRAVDGPEGVR